MSTPLDNEARVLDEARNAIASPGWLHRRDFATCLECSGQADYLLILDDALFPVCQGCACTVTHPGRSALDGPFAKWLCPGCQFVFAWAN